MAEIIRIDNKSYENLLNEFKVRLPSAVGNLAATAIAKTATTARLREQDRAMPSLKMGQLQQSTTGGSENRQYGVVKTFSKKTRQGWASTTRTGKHGAFALAHFAWERAKTTKTRKAAAYTSQLANLWGNPTKPYSTASPAVGDPNNPIRFGRGARRQRRYFWSMTEAVMRDSIATGIKKAEEAERMRPNGVFNENR